MKINWGSGIAALYITFIVFVLAMVYMAFGEKYELVTEDYYQQEIEFQGKIDRSTNAYALDDKLKISVKDGHLILEFPKSKSATSGLIHFFRPSDKSADFDATIDLDEGVQEIDLNKFLKGKYLVKTEWENEGKEYFQEDIIIIP